MKRRWIIRSGLIGLALGLARAGWLKADGDPGLMLIYFIFVGALVALLTVKWVLPWAIEALTTSLFFPGEKVRPDESEEDELKDSNQREDG
jgi:hypothetical protein